jgi:hypothetical protein
VRGVPHTVVVGADGNIEHLKIGASRSDKRSGEMLRGAIDRALAKPAK